MAGLLFALVTGAVGIAFFGRWQEEANTEARIARSFLGAVQERVHTNRRSYHAHLQKMADFIGEPKYGLLSYQAGWGVGAVMVLIGLVPGLWISAVLSPLGFFLPYLWLSERVKKTYRTLEAQSRQFRLLVIFLIRSGAPVPDAIASATKLLQAPLRPYLDRVVRQVGWGGAIQSLTVREAFGALKKELPVPSLIKMAQSFELTETMNVGNLDDQLMRSLTMEEASRNNLAYKQMGKIQMKIDLVSALGLDMLLEFYLTWVGFQAMGIAMQAIHF